MPEMLNQDDSDHSATDIGGGTGGGTAEEQSPERRNNIVLFGKYELGKLLGCGGFAKVYHARDVRTGQSVAIKAVRKDKVEKGNLTAHVKREVSIMRRLRHPHIIRLLEVLASKTKIYFVMEFAKGGELFAKVAKGRFSEDLSRRYFHQLIAAVGYCHSRGVYHRDLKPENLLLDEHWSLKISDFGLSAVKEQTRPDGMLHTLCGTPAYVAPEVLAKKGYDGAKVDVWSCGIILYVLSTGYLPFNDTNLMNLYRKIYRGDFRCPKWMSPELKRLISRLLDTNPETRITVDEILDDAWFKKGYKEVKLNFYDEKDEIVKHRDIDELMKIDEDEDDSPKFLNAFDLISFSRGFSLSGLFVEKPEEAEVKSRETFLTAEMPEKAVEKIEAAAREVEMAARGGHAPRVLVERTKKGVMVQGQNGNFGVVVEVHRLTEELAVVEVKKREKDVGPSHDFWKNKLRPRVSHLFYQPNRPGSITGGPAS